MMETYYSTNQNSVNSIHSDIQVTKVKKLHDGSEILNPDLNSRFYDNNPTAIVRISPDSKILDVNRSFLSMLGYPDKESFLNDNQSDFTVENKEEYYSLASKWLIIDEGQQTCFHTKDGKDLPVKVDIHTFQDKNGEILYYDILIENQKEITELKSVISRYEHMFESMLRFSGEAIGIIEEDRRLSYASKKMSEILGYDVDSLVGSKEWMNFINNGDIGKVREFHDLRRNENGEAPQEYEFSIRTYDGTYKHIGIKVDFVAETGQSICYLKDITSEETLKKNMEESEFLFHSLLENVNNIAVQGHLPGGKVIFWNKASQELYGYSYKEAISQNISDLIILPESRETFFNTISQAIEKDKFPEPGEYIKRNKSGEKIPVYSSRIIIERKDDEPYVFCIDLSLKDIEKTKAVLRDTNLLLQTIVNTPDNVMIFSLDKEFNYTSFNRSHCEKIYESQNVSVLNSENFFDAITNRHVKSEMIEIFNKVINGKKIVYEDNLPFYDKGQQYQITFTPIISRTKEVTGLAAFIVDISERVINEERQKCLETQLCQALKMDLMGRLAGSIAHDFNNHLTTISNISELALFDISDHDPLKHSLKDIADTANKAGEMTRHLLAFTRKESLRNELIDPGVKIHKMHRMLKRLVHENITVEIKIEDDVPNVFVNKIQFDQILFNLVINARDAMPEGGTLKISVESCELSNVYFSTIDEHVKGKWVKISVSDNGIGMTEETLNQVFDIYFTTKGEGKGTGLGLSTVYAYVQQNNGHIEVKSEIGKGSNFTYYFPSRSDKIISRVESATDIKELSGNNRILVVEDEDDVRKVTVRSLERFNYEVVEANSGEAALEIIEKDSGGFDLLITDVLMRNISGPKLYELIKNKKPKVKVLFMSGYTQDVIQIHGIDAEKTPFMSKPFSPRELLKKVKSMLED